MRATTPSVNAPRRLVAWSLAFNLPFVVLGVQRMAFDTYIHIFLADHYFQRWWSLWEPRWYLGFSMASYPPLVHQLIALLARPLTGLIAFFAPEPELYPGAFRFLGEEAAYVGLLLATLAALPLAVRAYARIFVGPRAAGWAGLAAVFLPALSLAGWAFGQLPHIAATTLLLWACARASAYTRRGDRWALAQTLALAGAAGAAHHGALLLAPFAALAMVGHDMYVVRRSGGSLLRYGARVALWAVLSALAVAVVSWPFLQWSRGQALQTPIDHASRHDFLTDPPARRFFFWPVYGPLLGAIPIALRLAAASARRRALLAAIALLFLLGLGGTTPLPKLLFGAGWEWLVYERFGFWAALLLLPTAGAILLTLQRRRPRGWGSATPIVALLGAMALCSAWAGWLCVISRSQPTPVDLTPIARFLNEPSQRPYRYLTLGFGDQLARLSTVTDNGTPDGDYHTARTLPELRSSGLGTLDGALWNPQGPWALAPILARPQRYGLRWAFVHHPAYAPVLEAAGWKYRFMVGEVQAWEYPAAEALPLIPPPQSRLATLWWGIAPLAVLAAAVVTALAPRLRAADGRISREQAARQVALLHRMLWTVTMITLALWWVHILRPGTLKDVYFVYQSVLVYASDIALAATLLVWGLERWLRAQPLAWGPRGLLYAGLGLIAACLLSAINSLDPGLSLATAAHLALLAGLYCMCLNDPPHPAQMGWAFGALMLAQAGLAAVQAATQSTLWPAILHLRWPGAVTAAQSGAAVVGASEGMRFLRAYGTFPHPNLLGGMLVVCLGIGVERYLAGGRKAWLGALAVGTAALFLTFSRAAWAGAATMGLASLLLLPLALRARARRALAVMALSFALLAMAFRPIVLARLGAARAPVTLESRSTRERLQLLGYALQAIRERPLSGLGAGTFAQWIYSLPGKPVTFEPVHNVPLLLAAEMGLPGAVAALALGGAILWRIARRRQAMGRVEAAWAGIVLGMLVISLADHYDWTMAPMRVMFVMGVGLCVGMGLTPSCRCRPDPQGISGARTDC